MNRLSEHQDVTLPDEHERLSRWHREQLHQLKNANASIHDLAWELEEVEQRLQALVMQREGPIDILLERELQDLLRRKAELEDSMIHQMLRTDELVAQLEDLKQAIQRHTLS